MNRTIGLERGNAEILIGDSTLIEIFCVANAVG
jgi:hypothetical protein